MKKQRPNIKSIPLYFTIVDHRVNQLHHRVTPTQRTCHIITLIQFTYTHTASNKILTILENRTLEPGLKQKGKAKHET